MFEKISLLKPPKDENGYPIHSDGSRLSIFIILKAKVIINTIIENASARAIYFTTF